MPLDVRSLWPCRRALPASPARQERIKVSSAWADCTSDWSDRPKPVNMRVLFGVLYPFLSISVFGFYPSMVSSLFPHFSMSQCVNGSRKCARIWGRGSSAPAFVLPSHASVSLFVPKFTLKVSQFHVARDFSCISDCISSNAHKQIDWINLDFFFF